MISTILLILYIIITLWSILSIIMHGTRPTKSLSWIFTVIIPFAGPLIYYLFGVNRRKFKFFKLKGTQIRRLYDEKYQEMKSVDFEPEFEISEAKRLEKLIRSTSLLAAHGGNKVDILHSGEETFEAIFEAIKNAKVFIHLQYYIFGNGELQDKFYQLFKEKIKEGVEIRMLYDSFGSSTFRGKLKKRFRDIGVKAYPTMPLRFGSLLYTLNYRNHRKIVVIDGECGFTGGVNVSDKYIKPISDLGIWEDLHVGLQGPIVNSLHRVFIKDYHFASKNELLLQSKYLPKPIEAGKTTVQISASGPDSNQPVIMQQYIGMINLAKSRICIANPYFIPGISVLQALKIAALSGVEVNILVPEKLDSKLAKYSMFSNFEEFLTAGIHIYIRKDFSHGKVIVIDDSIASVGSGNFDYRSFEHNFEANALIYDTSVAKKIVIKFDEACSKARLLSLKTFKSRSIWQKFKEGFAKFFSPVL